MCSIENRTISTPPERNGDVVSRPRECRGSGSCSHIPDSASSTPFHAISAPNVADQHMDDDLEPLAHPLGDDHEQRFHADVAGVAHAHGAAEERELQHQHQRRALHPRRRVVHARSGRRPGTVTRGDDQPRGRRHSDASGSIRERTRRSGNMSGIGRAPARSRTAARWNGAGPRGGALGSTARSARQFVAWILLTMSFSFGSVMNLS